MSRPTDPGKAWRQARGIPIVAAFDGYRALAVIGVVLFHVFEVCGVLLLAGDSVGGMLIWGVLPASLTVFFIVSGFVMFLPTAVRGGEFGRVSSFAIGRMARILPAYWLSLVIALLLLTAFESGSLPGLGTVAAHLGMVQTPALLVDGPVIVNGAFAGHFSLGFGVVAPVWTLSVETVFYLILPLVAVAYFRRPLVGLATAAALLIGWHVVGLHIGAIASAVGIDVSAATEARFHDYYASQFPSWGLALASGMTGAWMYVHLRDRFPQPVLERGAQWTTVAAVPAVALLVFLAGHDAVNDPNPLNGLFARQSLGVSLAYPLVLATAMVAFSLAPRRLQRPLANEPMRGLADISYSVYLIHFAVIWFALHELSLAQTGSLGATLGWSALVFPVSIVYAYISARFFERPIRRWANRYRRRGQPAAPAPAVAPAPPRVAGGAEAPPVSLLIPTHNRPAWLRGAVDSVLAQDYPNLELLVVDDGSTDDTPSLLADYAGRHPEDRFRFLRQENAGQAVALNNGNAEARGEIVGYLSDDDLLAPGAVTRLAGELIADPDTVAAYPGYRVIDDEGKIVDTVKPIEYSPLEALRLHDTIIGPGGLVQRSALEASGGWDPNLRWMGDLILWMGVGLTGRVVRVSEPLAYWRRHAGAATAQVNPDHAKEHLRIVTRGLALPRLGPQTLAVRAEALRNACLIGMFWAGGASTALGQRFTSIDLHRPRISTVAAGLEPGGEVDERAEEFAGLWRQIARNLIEIAQLRTALSSERSVTGAPETTHAAARPPGSGLEKALSRLRTIGALPGEDGSMTDDVADRDLRTTMVEAAADCGADTDPETTRFLLIDRQAWPMSEDEHRELIGLGFRASLQSLRSLVERQQQELERLRSRSSSLPSAKPGA